MSFAPTAFRRLARQGGGGAAFRGLQSPPSAFRGQVGTVVYRSAGSTARVAFVGVSRNSAGVALGGCTMTLLRRTPEGIVRPVMTTVSDATGTYRFDDPGTGPFQIRLTKAGTPFVAGLSADTLQPAPLIAPDVGSGSLTGLDWDGTGTARRMLYWLTPPAMYPMTFLFKVFQRQQVGVAERYYTTFFWGNNGPFVWGAGYDRSYYGAHPYPIPANTGDGKWEISASANDFVTLDDATSPYVTMGAWYAQAFRATDSGGGVFEHKFWVNLPATTTANTITQVPTGAAVVPTTPAIVMGQAPDNGSGLSWGGYPRWEEQNAIIRGIQFHSSALTQAQIVALSAFDTDAAVLAYCSANGIATPWYLNMNPTPTDVTDKSGNARHGSWAGAARPTLWQG